MVRFRSALSGLFLGLALGAVASAQTPGQQSPSSLGAPATPPPAAPAPAKAPKPATSTPAKKPPVVTPGKASPHAQKAAAPAKQKLHKPPPAKPAPQPAAPAPEPAAPEPPPATAAAPETAKGTASGLPLPRFAALRSDEVNMRTGPGTRYPIDWVYRRRDLPVEIEREFEVWRLISDADGTKGWVHQATLTGRRTFEIRDKDRTLRHDPQDSADAVAVLKPGVVGRIRTCAAGADWCEVQAGEYRGFLKRMDFWGSYPGEAVNN